MKKLYIIIALTLWGFAQTAGAQNMYRKYLSSNASRPNSAVSVVHTNGYVYLFQTNNSNISVTEINPLSMLPTGIQTDYLLQSQLEDFHLNGAFETFNGDFILFGYCIDNNRRPVFVKILKDLSSCEIYQFLDEGEFTAGCWGRDWTLNEVFLLVSAGKLYGLQASNLTNAFLIQLDMNTNPYDIYTDISWDEHNKKFIATGSTWNGTNSWLHPFVEVFDLNNTNVTPIANYIVDNLTYHSTNEYRALHTQLSKNELLLYQDLRDAYNQYDYDIIWFTRISNFQNNTTANIAESWFYRLPDTKLTAKDMIYDSMNIRLNFLGVFNQCREGLTQILAQVDPYSLFLGINIGQLGASFIGGSCTDTQDSVTTVYYNSMDMSNLAWNPYNPCYPILIAGIEGEGGILTETYDISLSTCDKSLWHDDFMAFPVLKPYLIKNTSHNAYHSPINASIQSENISVLHPCDEPNACSHQFGGKSLKQDLDSQGVVVNIFIENNSSFVCDGFSGEIQYTLYDIMGKILHNGSTQNQVRNALNVSGSMYILKAKDSAGNQVVKKIVLL